MSFVKTLLAQWDYNRTRTLSLLEAAESLPEPARALTWQPGPGRAHLGWHLMHIAATEEAFATERLLGEPSSQPDLLARFGRDSEAGPQLPSPREIREFLAASRTRLRAVFEPLSDDELGRVPPALAERGWDLRKTMQVLTWHEAHHQGQGHAVLNLFKAQG
jgi:uncharacterized damage-inducible protein DinB